MVIVMIFMAVTSSGASEMLAVSSLFTFDIYRRYINPKVIWSSCWAPLLTSLRQAYPGCRLQTLAGALSASLGLVLLRLSRLQEACT